MIRKNRLFTPGPTQLLPAAQLAMAAATMHHRTAEFRALYTKVLADLKTFVGTNNDVVLFAASGTGAMEAQVGDRSLLRVRHRSHGGCGLQPDLARRQGAGGHRR